MDNRFMEQKYCTQIGTSQQHDRKNRLKVSLGNGILNHNIQN